ncbi:hypothetical protein SAMN02949497_4004 [Methylomagnum ishizawai]|uniref:Uncharacterized protein n=1 Tax=Methylomagnum ishizawai TaxID=1760988 RepID=A0A1Y6D0Z7_9GAMM|nr:hypothetical protein [Methylomagnum ishizawai]SMF96598.1 hypothetical protein SAMN02949497_4004 [Methylomagnum ishizawai]
MNAKEFAQKLKQQIEVLKNDGIESIGTDNLIIYLAEYIESSADADIELQKANLQKWVEEHKFAYSERIELFKSVINSGQASLRTAFLMNGGATVALLTFIGHLSTSEKVSIKIPLLANSLTTFVFGIFIAALATGAVYLSELKFYSAHRKVGLILNKLAISLGLISYLIFMAGTCMAYNFFLHFSP